jgi:hypothetical protein
MISNTISAMRTGAFVGRNSSVNLTSSGAAGMPRNNTNIDMHRTAAKLDSATFGHNRRNSAY